MLLLFQLRDSILRKLLFFIAYMFRIYANNCVDLRFARDGFNRLLAGVRLFGCALLRSQVFLWLI